MDKVDVDDLDLDTLLDDAAALAMAESTVAARWTEAELAFIRDNVSYLTPEEMAAALGRSAVAVHLARKRHNLPTARHLPGWYSLQQVANLFGVDSHSVHAWADRGYLPARYIASASGIRMASERAIKQFAVNPNHWMMFKVERIQDDRLRSLIFRRMERWGDEWWRPGDVAKYHSLIDSSLVNNAVNDGTLPAVRWGNWWIRKSHAIAHYFNRELGWWSSRKKPSRAAYEFTVLADAIGVHPAALERMLNLDAGYTGSGKSGTHRINMLKKSGMYAEIAATLTGISFDEETGEAWGDWRRFVHRFPGFARRLRAWRDGNDLDDTGRTVVRHLLRKWAEWFADTPEEQALVRQLARGTVGHPVALENAYGRFVEVLGIDPLAERGQGYDK